MQNLTHKLRIVMPVALLVMLQSNAPAQSSPRMVKAPPQIDYSNPDLLPPPPQAPGFPSRAPDLDVLPGFRNPPPGYGQVPFWWWSGDSLRKDRLLWQIEQLHAKGIPGMQVNYMHKDTPGWPTYPAEPEIFSDAWWEMWRFAADECGKRGMGIGLSGYTLDWPRGDNLFNRMIYTIVDIQGRELIADTVLAVEAGNTASLRLPVNTVGIRAYADSAGIPLPGGIDLSSLVRDSVLTWRPETGRWHVWVFTAPRIPGTLNPIHPRSGATVIEKFFRPFQDRAAGQSAEGLNYFFQDELQFGVGDRIWTDDFPDAFRAQKGYDVFELLPAMFTDIGRPTVKGRLDFLDVKVRLSEERYFKPIFDWHWTRGKIYGCDPEGRGREPGAYGDNFRANRWYTAPGHDTPGGHADLIKGKVSSSIAALYKRPRVWLEGYHSLGWGATPGQLMFATNENYLYGCNLLNLHGLYYTTHGSHWEWAPPCYHFRMPYWEHMGVFLRYFERLSYLLSQGVLVADVAVMYPVSPTQAQLGAREATETAFSAGTVLFNSGHDFLFLDDQSLTRATYADGRLRVSDHSFRVLVLPAMKAIRWQTLQQALEHFRHGGVVVAVGSLPEASDRAGTADPTLDAAVKELFGVTAEEAASGKPSIPQTNPAGGKGVFVGKVDRLREEADLLLPRDVRSDLPIRAAHRKIGPRDVYMVMGAARGSVCTFRSKGKVEQWDPWTGNTRTLYEVSSTPAGTRVKMPLDSLEAQIIVFSPEPHPGELISADLDQITGVVEEKGVVTGFARTPGRKRASLRMRGRTLQLAGTAETSPAPIALDGDWNFELQPTMDNRWGDFRLPVTEPTIGPEARRFRYAEETSKPLVWESPHVSDAQWPVVTHGFGQKFWKLGPLPVDADLGDLERELARRQQIDPAQSVFVQGQSYSWQPYSFSWRMGLEGDPGHQGWHGLKEEVTDDFICLGKPTEGHNEILYREEEGGTRYFLWTSAFTTAEGRADVHAGGLLPAAVYVNGVRVDSAQQGVALKRGSNPVLLRYDAPGRGHFVLQTQKVTAPTDRTPLSMRWYDMAGRVVFDTRPWEKTPAAWYRFTAPPGLRGMTIRARGRPEVWVNGSPQVVQPLTETGRGEYKVSLQRRSSRNALVALRIEQERGDYGGSTLPEPILLDCGPGLTQTGDWSVGSSLECYSGGAWYRKTFTLSGIQARSRVKVNLGDVVATAEVRVNGTTAGILVSPPWSLDISSWVKEGTNHIEILVTNTLGNHYSTIPTRYRGRSLRSGLIGPVTLDFSAPVTLVPLAESQ